MHFTNYPRLGGKVATLKSSFGVPRVSSLWVVPRNYSKCGDKYLKCDRCSTTLWALRKTTQSESTNLLHIDSTQSVSGCRSTLWALLTTTQRVLGSHSTLWVVVMSGQCVIGSLTHFGWFCEVPKVWWNTCHTLGTYRHTLGISAELPKVSWFILGCAVSLLRQSGFCAVHTGARSWLTARRSLRAR